MFLEEISYILDEGGNVSNLGERERWGQKGSGGKGGRKGERVIDLQGPMPAAIILGRARAWFGSDFSYCDCHWFGSASQIQCHFSVFWRSLAWL